MDASEVEICSNCKREIPSSEQACVFKGEIVCAECDKNLRRRPTAAPAARTSDSNHLQTEAKYKGVGGWLLLFCLFVIVISPLANLFFFFTLLSGEIHSMAEYPRYRLPFIIQSLTSAGVITFGVYAGISLWRVRPNAVNIAKVYLVIYLCNAILRLLLSFFLAFGLPTDFSTLVIKEGFKQAVYPYLIFKIWYSYLNKSKRVKATYPEYIKVICPECGRSVWGATQDMIGDIGVCGKCKAEFVIEVLNKVRSKEEKG